MEFIEKLITVNRPLRELLESVDYSRLEECRIKYLRRGDLLLNAGAETDKVWFLINGEMWSYNTFLNGHRYSTERILPGSFIGDMELVGNYQTYISSVTTINRSTVLEIPGEVFMHWFGTFPDFTRRIAVANAAARCRAAMEVGVNNMLSASDSICMLLYNLYNERAPMGGSIVISETRQSLSEHVGISLRSVNRAVAGLEQKGIISLNKGKIVLNEKSREKLLALVNENNSIRQGKEPT